MKRRVIIDSDGKLDDLIALFVALKSPQALAVLGITTTGRAFSTAPERIKGIFEKAKRFDVPVFAGAPRPFFPGPLFPIPKKEEELTLPFSENSLETSPAPSKESTLHGVDFLLQSLLHTSQKVTLLALGPLTNIALAIIREPRIRQHIEELVVVGGALIEGDATPAAEYNFYTDPLAASVVLSSRVPLTLLTLESTNAPLLGAFEERKAFEELEEFGTKFLGEKVKTPQRALYGVVYLLAPSFFQNPRFLSVEIDTSESLLKGRSTIDWFGKLGKTPHATLFESVDVQGIKAYLRDRKNLLDRKVS